MTNLLVSLVVSVCVATVTVWLSLRRFRTERWWERKAEAYSRILNALHALAEHAAARADAELGDRYAEEEVKRRKEAGDNAWVELQRATEIGAYAISTEAANALNRLRYRSRVGIDDGDWYSLYSEDHAAYTKALAELRSLAKKDLGVAYRLSGRTRLGSALSGLWLLLAPAAYVLGRASYPSWWTTMFDRLYRWEQKPPVPPDPATGLDFQPLLPQPDLLGLALLALAPIAAGWLVLFVAPRTVRWVREGFLADSASHKS